VAANEDEEELLRSVALQNAKSILLARQRAEEELVRAKEALERKSAELAYSLARLRVTLSSIGDAVITTDPQGRVTSLNPVAESLTGWAQDQATGQPLDAVFRIVDEQTRQPVENRATTALREGVIVGLANHTVLITKDGAERPIDDSASPIHDEHGHAVGCVLIFRDVTEKRRAEEALRQSEERYRSLTQAITSVVWTVDELGRFVTPQPSWAAFTGQTWEELRDFGWTNALHPDDRERVWKLWETARASRALYKSDGRVWHAASGSYHHVEARAVPMLNPDGSVREWVGECLDITDRKLVEEVLQQAEERLRFVLDSAPQKIFTAKPNGDVDYFNPQWTEFTGLSFEQIKDWGWTKFIHPDDVEENVRVWQRSIDTGAPFHFEHRFRRADGEYRWHLSRAVPLWDAEDKVVMWVGSNTDIHEQRQTANQLRQYAADLSEADRRKNEFLAMLAHELRNPLAPIRHAVQILRLTGGDAQAVSAASEMLERQISQMVRLVDDLLDVSRISRGKIELRKEQVELAPIVNQAVEAARLLVECMEHELAVSLPTQPLYLNADPTRLAQVVGNLLNNACKFTNKGGRIWLTVEREAEQAVIRVRDNGIGVAADQLSRIFDMFTQVDTTLERSASGLGIGLSLVKNLVEMHDGTVEVHSAGVGQGSEFVVRLPILAETAKPAPEPTVSEPMTMTARRILVVEDNRDSAESLAMLLTLTGNETHTAYDGLEAVEAAATFRPDVVLLDIGLPKMNGYEAARKIREQPWGKKMVLVALTGWGQEEDRQKSRDAGFDGHLVKPVDQAALTKLLAEL